MDYFISDLHIDDKNIMTYEHRPFSSLEEMRETIINNWNSIVSDNDNVYLLGDIGKDAYVLRELNGFITVVMGNHDKEIQTELFELQRKGHIELFPYPIMINNSLWLSHEPIGYMPPECPYLNIHGHLHRFHYGLLDRSWAGGNRYFNVSVEQINYTPISTKEIATIIGYK